MDKENKNGIVDSSLTKTQSDFSTTPEMDSKKKNDIIDIDPIEAQSLRSTISKVVNETEASLESETPEEGIYLFFSLDLSNSTQFKAEHPTLWAFVISSFYKAVNSNLVAIYEDPLCQWKLIGDEVLLYREISGRKNIYEDVKDVYTTLPEIIDSMIGDTLDAVEKSFPTGCDHSCGQTDNVEYAIRSTLGIKATAWIAQCSEPSNKRSARNIIYESSSSTTDSLLSAPYDFLGPDIDEGFRLCKYAVKNQMIVSPLLAHIIHKLSKSDPDKALIIESNFRITAFVELKGIWQSRAVPIVMFCPDFEHLFEKIEYDQIGLPAYGNIYHTKLKDFLADPRCKVSYLEKVFDNLARRAEITSLFEKIVDPPKAPFTSRHNSPSPLEFHIACAIITDDHKLLVHHDAKRGLEFGCFQFKPNKHYLNWMDFCQVGYEAKYKLSIQVDSHPLPLDTYCYIKSKNNTVLGIILPAHFHGDITNLPKDWKAYSENELTQLEQSTPACVEHFFENAKKSLLINSEE